MYEKTPPNPQTKTNSIKANTESTYLVNKSLWAKNIHSSVKMTVKNIQRQVIKARSKLETARLCL